LGKEVEIFIDRPLGSKHPKHGFLYKANYGYIPGTTAPDKGELDAYYLGIDEHIEKGKGIGIAIVHRLHDDDDRLIIVPKSKKNMEDDEIKKLVHFQEKFTDFVLVR
jgi:inorganic pyrophosphatase